MRVGRRNKSRDGFTIVELMVTVLIMGVIAAMAFPAVQSAFNTQLMSGATQEVMHLVDYARIQALSRNRAYRMVVEPGAGTNGRIVVDESENTLCSGFSIKGVLKIKELNFNTKEYASVRIVALSPTGFGSLFQLCFTPNGRVVQTDTSKPVTSNDPNYGAGEAIIAIQRVGRNNSGQETLLGVIHQIVVPYNGIPRFKAGKPPVI